MKTEEKYKDIIDLPHFHDKEKPYMNIEKRAAQFASYKSLRGYEEMIASAFDENML